MKSLELNVKRGMKTHQERAQYVLTDEKKKGGGIYKMMNIVLARNETPFSVEIIL